jgi:hypothetical protein
MDSIRLFLESCRSQETRNSYQLSFQKYIEFVGNDLFFGNNPRMIESKIRVRLISKEQRKVTWRYLKLFKRNKIILQNKRILCLMFIR